MSSSPTSSAFDARGGSVRREAGGGGMRSARTGTTVSDDADTIDSRSVESSSRVRVVSIDASSVWWVRQSCPKATSERSRKERRR